MGLFSEGVTFTQRGGDWPIIRAVLRVPGHILPRGDPKVLEPQTYTKQPFNLLSIRRVLPGQCKT